ncbi:MAG: hypothetical protein C0616_00135 [Desulfuromonas sp.]|nr:MAG: hypothetical protein C0616_00135 [Desulfuromonas sp.]
MGKEHGNILVVDDEAPMRHMLRLLLERNGYAVAEASSGRQGLSRLQTGEYPLVLCDIRMPDLNGLEFLQEKLARELNGTVIMMSAYGTIDTAVECMKNGAYDFISKPFRPDEVLLAIRKAEERLELHRENTQLKQKIRRSVRPQGLEAIVHRSASMKELLATVAKVASSSASVLITGETGTGKELVARALHLESPRCDKPFLAVNCSAIASGLLESELFGHARGAFTGADREREGLFGAADGGTLLLDEIADLPMELQPKLLRVLQEQEVRRVGESRARKIDVRLVAASATNLADAVTQGRFREDLYYRLAVVTLEIPPLRKRRDDIAALVESYLPLIASRMNRPVPRLSDQAMAKLESHDWPGNVRELVNCLEKTLVLCHEEFIEETALTLPGISLEPERALSLKTAVAELERDHICRALAETGGNRTRAAKLLEISLRALMYKIKDYRIDG